MWIVSRSVDDFLPSYIFLEMQSDRLWDWTHITRSVGVLPLLHCKAAVHAFLGLGQSKSFTLAKPSAESFSHTKPILLKFRGAYYSSPKSPYQLMKVHMPVMVARSSIHGSSMPRLLESSLICSALAFPCHGHGLRIDLKNRQLLSSQEVLLCCLCAGRS